MAKLNSNPCQLYVSPRLLKPLQSMILDRQWIKWLLVLWGKYFWVGLCWWTSRELSLDTAVVLSSAECYSSLQFIEAHNLTHTFIRFQTHREAVLNKRPFQKKILYVSSLICNLKNWQQSETWVLTDYQQIWWEIRFELPGAFYLMNFLTFLFFLIHFILFMWLYF